MISKVFSSDLIKIKGKGLWLLAFVGSLGIVALQLLNFGLRYDYMVQSYTEDLWGGLLTETALFVPISVNLGITMLSSQLANIEHANGSWKQLLALPVPRIIVLLSKFVICIMLLLLSGILLAAGTAVLGVALRFDVSELPYTDLLRLSFYPLIASLPVLSLMLWLCMTMKNQALPITLGVVLAVFSVFPIVEWVPVSWPMLSYKGPHREWFISAGAGLGILILLVGTVHFHRKEVV